MSPECDFQRVFIHLDLQLLRRTSCSIGHPLTARFFKTTYSLFAKLRDFFCHEGAGSEISSVPFHRISVPSD